MDEPSIDPGVSVQVGTTIFDPGSGRRECLDHTIVLNDRHLRRVLKEHLAYYQRVCTWRFASSVFSRRGVTSRPDPLSQIGGSACSVGMTLGKTSADLAKNFRLQRIHRGQVFEFKVRI